MPSFIDSLEIWGVFASQLNDLYVIEYVSYILTFLGFIVFFFSQNILSLFKIPRVRFNIFSKRDNKNSSISQKIKKEPIINNNQEYFLSEEKMQEFSYKENFDQKTKYFSPSLEILDSNNALSQKRTKKENIKAESDLLEKVFQDFNIEIQVVDVKLGRL